MGRFSITDCGSHGDTRALHFAWVFSYCYAATSCLFDTICCFLATPLPPGKNFSPQRRKGAKTQMVRTGWPHGSRLCAFASLRCDFIGCGYAAPCISWFEKGRPLTAHLRRPPAERYAPERKPCVRIWPWVRAALCRSSDCMFGLLEGCDPPARPEIVGCCAAAGRLPVCWGEGLGCPSTVDHPPPEFDSHPLLPLR